MRKGEILIRMSEFLTFSWYHENMRKAGDQSNCLSNGISLQLGWSAAIRNSHKTDISWSNENFSLISIYKKSPTLIILWEDENMRIIADHSNYHHHECNMNLISSPYILTGLICEGECGILE